MKRASIDLGTNTCLCLVRDGDVILHDESRMVRLGQGLLQNKVFLPEAMERAYAAIKDYAAVVQGLGIAPESVVAVATAQARESKNAQEFFNRLESQLGIRFQILSGEQEAAATFRGAGLPGVSVDSMWVMDIGGGSTEIFTALNNGGSLSWGAVKITEKFLHSDPVTDAEFWSAEEFLDEQIASFFAPKSLKFDRTANTLVAVAGTAVQLAQLQLGLSQFDRNALDQVVLTEADVHRWVEELKWRTLAERRAMPGMEPGRADVLLGGALLYWRIMAYFGIPQSRVSTRGLRFGVLL